MSAEKAFLVLESSWNNTAYPAANSAYRASATSSPADAIRACLRRWYGLQAAEIERAPSLDRAPRRTGQNAPKGYIARGLTKIGGGG